MKTIDLQQMQQQYQLIAENNGEHNEMPPIQQTYDKYINIHRDLHNAIESLQLLMSSDEFKFAVNNDWMGIDEEESETIPSDFDDYVEIYLDHLY